MSLTDIASKVSLFNPSETVVTDLTGANVGGNMRMNLQVAKDKNNILLLNGSIIGDINISITSVPHLNAEAEQELTTTAKLLLVEAEGRALNATSGITKAVAMIQGAGAKRDLVLYYPLLSGAQIDPRLAISSDETTTTIKSAGFNDLATPGGKGMILIFTKTTSSQNLTVNISRPSYTSQICAPSAECTIPEHYCDADGKISKGVFWGVTATLIVLLLLVMLLCWWCNRGDGKKAAASSGHTELL